MMVSQQVSEELFHNEWRLVFRILWLRKWFHNRSVESCSTMSGNSVLGILDILVPYVSWSYCYHRCVQSYSAMRGVSVFRIIWFCCLYNGVMESCMQQAASSISDIDHVWRTIDPVLIDPRGLFFAWCHWSILAPVSL